MVDREFDYNRRFAWVPVITMLATGLIGIGGFARIFNPTPARVRGIGGLIEYETTGDFAFISGFIFCVVLLTVAVLAGYLAWHIRFHWRERIAFAAKSMIVPSNDGETTIDYRDIRKTAADPGEKKTGRVLMLARTMTKNKYVPLANPDGTGQFQDIVETKCFEIHEALLASPTAFDEVCKELEARLAAARAQANT